jgi:DNA-binding Lrp family transcriptional regulator
MRLANALDWMDFKILALLQRQGRASNVDVANAVGLSPSPCLARTKRLQEIGVITGYGAHLSLAMMGSYILVFVEITIDKHRRPDLARFEQAAETVPEILECYNISGGYDYMLKIVTKDTSHFVAIMDKLLGMDIGIVRFQSYIVLREPFANRSIPIELLFEY